MRRQAFTVLLTLGALAATGGVSHGGEATVAPNGDFLMLDADLSSPIAGTRATPRPVAFNFHHMFGNYRTGEQGEGVQRITVRLPRGLVVNPDLVGECPLPTSSQDVRPDRCPASSRVGTGTALADARSAGVAEPIPATVTAYDGPARNGRPTLILQGVAMVGTTQVTTEFDFENVPASGRFGSEVRTFDPTPSEPAGPTISLNKLDLRVGKTVTRRVRGRRVRRGYLEAPTTCPRSGWAFEEEFLRNNGTTLTAGDVMPCTR